MQNGLYSHLTNKKWMVSHIEVLEREFQLPDKIIILPQQIPTIVYPYEWSFAMWQDAALLTLNIAKEAIYRGMSLKDATPFNIQFLDGKPIFIDTLSFEKYLPTRPWVAYRQFCECFLAPLLLQKYCHNDTGKFFTIYPNGIPLDLLISLLPKKAKWNMHTYLHIYLQSHTKVGQIKNNAKAAGLFSQKKMLLLLNGLIEYVKRMQGKNIKSTWDDYYAATILSNQYLQDKTALVISFLKTIAYTTILDLGANDGHFSLLFKNTATHIIAVDGDANCINELYINIRNQKIKNILPVINTLQTPSPAIGWNNAERASFNERIKGDVVFALALVHHLAIANNLPFQFIADWLALLGKYLLIEFVPKTDEKVQLLLQGRDDIFDNYTMQNFEEAFLIKFDILLQQNISNTGRILYLMKKK